MVPQYFFFDEYLPQIGFQHICDVTNHVWKPTPERGSAHKPLPSEDKWEFALRVSKRPYLTLYLTLYTQAHMIAKTYFLNVIYEQYS